MARGIGNGPEIEAKGTFWALPQEFRDRHEELALARYNAIADERAESFFDLPPHVRQQARDAALAEWDRS